MTSNSSLFTIFQSHSSTSTVTLADGSKSCVIGSDTINPTPLIPLTYVPSLPHFSFNLIFVSKLTLEHLIAVFHYFWLLSVSGSFDKSDYW